MKTIISFLNKHSWGFVMWVSIAAGGIGILLQNQLIFKNIDDIERLGELYIAIGFTMAASFFAGVLTFIEFLKINTN